ncbi:hypothetical protein Lser_V15G04181 [Lactuca serriola]
MAKQATTLKAAVYAIKNVETQIREKGLEKTEVGEKRKLEGSSRVDKKGKFSKPNLDDQMYGAKWCEKCKKKHFGRCDGEVTCYKCGRTGHYSRYYTFDNRKCYECGDGGHILKNCPKKNEVARKNVSSKPKATTFQMILDEAGENARNQE